jgi:hypothetical protein
MSLGIIGIQDRDGFPGHYEGGTAAEIAGNVQAVLDCVAKGLGRPEVSNLPLVFYGFSKGAWMSGELGASMPQRTLCVATDKGGIWDYGVGPEGRFVPGFFVGGDLDTSFRYGGIALFELWRPNNGQAAVVQDWNVGHWGTDFDCIKAFIAHSVARRYPAGQLPSPTPGSPLALIKIDPNSGWLVEQQSGYGQGFTWIASPYAAPASQYSKNSSTACWVTDRTMAAVLRAKNAADPNTGARPVNLSCTGTGLVGQPIDLLLANNTLDAAAVTRVQVFHEDEVIGDYAAFSPTGISLRYTPTQSGVQTFWTEVTSVVAGQTSYAWNYCTMVVLAEPLPSLTDKPPVVNAGPDQTISLPGPARLAGQAYDDGLPADTTIQWSVVSGPGIVTFADANSPVTAAAVCTLGTYVLRLTASDSAHSVFSECRITVIPANVAPVVNAGSTQRVFLPSAAILSGTVSDDGLPNPPGTATVLWSKVSGPGTVTFGDAGALATTAAFSDLGSYVLRLTASDSALVAADDVSIIVGLGGNLPPIVNIPSVEAITAPTKRVSLCGSISDDGLPSPPSLTYAWAKVSGPGKVFFSNPASANTTATLMNAGTYVVRLIVSDGQLSGYSDVTVTLEGDLRADFNGDGRIDGLDFLTWQAGYPTACGATKATGDANGDGIVNGQDFLIWQSGYNCWQ